MELLIALAVLILFDIAAWFWGFDSRDGIEDDRNISQRPHRSI